MIDQKYKYHTQGQRKYEEAGQHDVLKKKRNALVIESEEKDIDKNDYQDTQI